MASDGNAHATLERRLQYTKRVEPEHPEGIKLFECWRSKQPEGGFVMGRDIPSRSIASLLHSIMVMEPVNGCADFRVRLAGTALRRNWGREITGMHFSEMFGPETLATQLQETAQVFETGIPGVLDVKEYEGNVVHLHREATILRILAPDRTSHWVMAGVFHFT